ncbi:hypothetical protein Vretimale_1625 [Volvox reticuliferus]|uniref:AB hydrolase-1 domain-containing protein n=1 Tax=Volvox reticuliferus TaxID=1737510 RepID=A0A8J4FRQ1_9CHLO|nr:hypothetical protein Vretifemale_15457 [Volvox reticuliferus]GIL95648.1 hypothetical protein Vretimale_1625 [Volvox reticuliferus]
MFGTLCKGRAPGNSTLCKREARPRVLQACPTSISATRLLVEERFDNFVTHAAYNEAANLPEPQWQDNQLRWSRPAEIARVVAPSGSPPIVILPGFGNASMDYTAPFGNEESSLHARLVARGWCPFVVPVERKDWFRVARALLTRGFWQGKLTTHPGYTWYLDRVAATVTHAMRQTGAEQVILVGHSAGGWLGRAYLGDLRYQRRQPADDAVLVNVAATAVATELPGPGTMGATPNPRVRALVTLGTPQRPPPQDKKRDMTGGAQGWVERCYPGAFFAAAGVSYVSVCGRTVRGHRDFPRIREGPRVVEEYAFDSYREVCGEGEGLVGDCVVPLSSAMLPGARHVILDGVFHSMSKIGTFDEDSGQVWYGSEDVLDCWLGPLVDELERGPTTGSAECGSGMMAGSAQGTSPDLADAV